ncbi:MULTISPECIES: TIGR03899 family protein [Vibrio]|uniref:TIGR03899 family protein n=1 Tax=Vibrio genomosp. F6 str. FF-238 TaxID=1191298 RepID=A0A1E5CUV5_9VIBR|nr:MULTISPECIES: TIGR03899 family protein [Vibrio]RBW66953.1 TIGR03899 family protein [Vibrionales bacterium C3R12]MDN3696736.1 TIGR03899 family protein [Vibrio cortegadensis]NOH85264.1 TIGR03899 family protein [Vibrio sp. 03-59-1]OEE73701.1 TIGR03899 family protein [Vibrio genomosp. F6 str. FF-238]TKF21887.1 TIGR03899 family protein [Vibrio genomosp. F6]
MAETNKPIVIEHESNTQSSTHQEKKSYIKDSASRVMNIAQSYSLDAMLQKDAPEKKLIERALVREKKRKEQRQKNLEQILKITHASCKDETAGEPDQDWLYRFFDMAQDIHNTSMQRLWAQVLKREVTNPGSTSMKALKILKDMTPKEAQNLQRAASLACSFGSDNSRKLLLGYKSHAGIFSFGKRDTTSTINLGSFQIPYSSLLLLIELGLLLGTELESGEIEFDPALSLTYQGKQISLQPLGKGVKLVYYRFSPTGNELCKLLGNKPNMQYYDQLVGLLSQKFTVQTEVKSTVHHTV